MSIDEIADDPKVNARIRGHPDYARMMRELSNAQAASRMKGQHGCPVDIVVIPSPDSVAERIRDEMQPLHANGIVHLGAELEAEMNTSYLVRAQVLRDTGYGHLIK